MRFLPALALLSLISSLPATLTAQCLTTERQKAGRGSAVANSFWGLDVSADAGTVLVGGQENLAPGAVSVLRRVSGLMTEQQVLTASDGVNGDWFGSALDLSGSRALIGAPFADPVGGGAAYVYRRIGGTFSEVQKLVSTTVDGGEGFGSSVALDGLSAAVGVPGHLQAGDLTGAVETFRLVGGTWMADRTLLASDAADHRSFGSRVALSGAVLVVSDLTDATLGSLSGAVYVFRDGPSGWVEEQKLVASDGAAGDSFGHSVAVDGDVIVVGSLIDRPAENTGAVYVFRFDGSHWNEEQKLSPHDGEEGADFGWSVDVEGDRLLVGRMNSVSLQSGAAHLFRDSGAGWVEVTKFIASDGQPLDGLGFSVDLGGVQEIVVGAAFADDSVAGQLAGAAYFYDAPELGLGSNATAVSAGDSLILGTCGGQPGAAMMLSVVGWNGVPTYTRIAIGRFDATGLHKVGGLVPVGLAGLSVEFESIGFLSAGTLGISSRLSVDFE